MNCPKCNQILFLEPKYKDNLCKNKQCSLYLKGDVHQLTNQQKPIINNKIKDVLDNFDFNKVHKVMTLLNWEWRHEGVPSIDKIKYTAKTLLEDCMNKGFQNNKEYVIKTGGLSALYDPKEDYLSLTFELEESYSFHS